MHGLRLSARAHVFASMPVGDSHPSIFIDEMMYTFSPFVIHHTCVFSVLTANTQSVHVANGQSARTYWTDLPNMHRMPEHQCWHNADESPCRPRIPLSLLSPVSPASHMHTICTHGTDLNPGCMYMGIYGSASPAHTAIIASSLPNIIVMQ